MATTTEISPLPRFTGEFRHRIEGKGRITVPSAWRYDHAVDLFMLRRSLFKCIGVLTRAELDRQQEVARQTMTPENFARFLHQFASRIFQVTLDKAGRITIPDELCAEYGIRGEVWLTGALDTFNIWNVANFEEQRKKHEPHDDDLMRQLGL